MKKGVKAQTAPFSMWIVQIEVRESGQGAELAASGGGMHRISRFHLQAMPFGASARKDTERFAAGFGVEAERALTGGASSMPTPLGAVKVLRCHLGNITHVTGEVCGTTDMEAGSGWAMEAAQKIAARAVAAGVSPPGALCRVLGGLDQSGVPSFIAECLAKQERLGLDQAMAEVKKNDEGGLPAGPKRAPKSL
jgi:hypothetical protein